MNKKILVLAFVSVALIFGCSADGSFNSSITPPKWKGEPSISPASGGGSSYKYCVVESSYDCLCGDMEGHTKEECDYYQGTLSNTCPSNCEIDD